MTYAKNVEGIAAETRDLVGVGTARVGTLDTNEVGHAVAVNPGEATGGVGLVQGEGVGNVGARAVLDAAEAGALTDAHRVSEKVGRVG